MKILLIGSGYLGQALLKYLRESNFILTATTTTKEKIPLLNSLAHKAVLIHSKELFQLKELVSETDACIVSVAPKESSQYRETYLETALTLRECVSHRETPLHLIYTSSTSVYGDQNIRIVDETTPLNPTSDHQKILAETENILLNLQSPFVLVTILRLAGLFGPNRGLEARLGSLLIKASAGTGLPGSGKEPTNHIHIDDVVRAIDFSIRNKLDGIFNLAMDEHPTREELYTALSSRLGLSSLTWDSSLKPRHGISGIVDSKKILSKGFVPTINSLSL